MGRSFEQKHHKGKSQIACLPVKDVQIRYSQNYRRKPLWIKQNESNERELTPGAGEDVEKRLSGT